MQENGVFLIEESDADNLVPQKVAANQAVYRGKFNEYIISKSQNLKNTLIITDIFSDRDGVDIVDGSILELIFSDAVKKFSEIYANFISVEDVTDENSDVKFIFEVTQEGENNCDEQNLVYKFNGEIENLDADVRSIKIFINGYDESRESVNLDLQILPQDSLYRYKIATDTIEITISTRMSAAQTRAFLSNFTYRRVGAKFNQRREIYFIINDKISHAVEIKFN